MADNHRRADRRVGKANGSRERAPDDRLRVPTFLATVRVKVGTARAPLPTLRSDPHGEKRAFARLDHEATDGPASIETPLRGSAG
jgi:hypothetical protein